MTAILGGGKGLKGGSGMKGLMPDAVEGMNYEGMIPEPMMHGMSNVSSGFTAGVSTTQRGGGRRRRGSKRRGSKRRGTKRRGTKRRGSKRRKTHKRKH